MSFGSELKHFPAAVPPGAEVVVNVEFLSADAEFEQHTILYVEEANGIRSISLTAKSLPSTANVHEQTPPQL